jgi:hypothetical protein
LEADVNFKAYINSKLVINKEKLFIQKILSFNMLSFLLMIFLYSLVQKNIIANKNKNKPHIKNLKKKTNQGDILKSITKNLIATECTLNNIIAIINKIYQIIFQLFFIIIFGY